jgi:hypothetical protein
MRLAIGTAAAAVAAKWTGPGSSVALIGLALAGWLRCGEAVLVCLAVSVLLSGQEGIDRVIELKAYVELAAVALLTPLILVLVRRPAPSAAAPLSTTIPS